MENDFSLADPFYQRLCAGALAGQRLAEQEARRVLTDPTVELLPLLQAAFVVRCHFFGRGVRVHILNNVQNGYCPEDCHYCAQAVESEAEIQKYRMKSDEEILAGAEQAYRSGAYRYCMVFSGRSLPAGRLTHMLELIRSIKAQWPIHLCLSAGFIDQETARQLKEAGLDRYNHNLNTAETYYGSICTTHTYTQRLSTLQSAHSAGLEVCSGLIIGMGESAEDILQVAYTLRDLKAKSIPVNFYVHIPGNKLGRVDLLTPAYCLRVLALFRLINPDAEIRAAGGREVNLRTMDALSLYPANSLFSQGYLNSGGNSTDKTMQMIEDAGFTVEKIEE